MSDYEPLNEEQRKVRNAVLIGVGVGVVGTALIMWRVNAKHISLVKAYADSVDATNEILTRVLVSEGKVIDVALKAGETLADVTSIHPAIPIPTP